MEMERNGDMNWKVHHPSCDMFILLPRIVSGGVGNFCSKYDNEAQNRNLWAIKNLLFPFIFDGNCRKITRTCFMYQVEQTISITNNTFSN